MSQEMEKSDRLLPEAHLLQGDPDAASSPRPYKRHEKLTPAEKAELGEIVAPRPTKAPIILTPEHNPAQILGELFDLGIAANTMLAEEFKFDEIYTMLIDLIRNDGDPKVRMGAADRLTKMVKDALVARGVVGKVVETAKVRSPDGTVAERHMVTRSVMRSMEENNPHVRQVRNEAEDLALPEDGD